jgi:tetratricopeptide (TPR) repeat protein
LPKDKTILLWFMLVGDALSSPQELSRRVPWLFNDLMSDRPSDIAKRTSRIRGIMWHPGDHPRLNAQPGIESISQAISFALGHPESAESSFDLEWERLERRQDQLQFLSALAYLGSSPVPMRLVFEGARVLPSPLRRTLSDASAVKNLLFILTNRGLLRRQGTGADLAVILPGRVRAELRRRTSSRQRRLILDRCLRFLTEALPPDTHHFAAWSEWRSSLPHVAAVLDQSAGFPSMKMLRAHLLDRRSVFFRDAESNLTAALTDARSAVMLAESTNLPNPGEYSIFLGNLAITENRVGMYDEAVEHFDAALKVTRDSRGVDNEDYAGTLELKANMLSFAGKTREATRAYAEAEEIIRRIYEQDPSEDVVQVYREVLNDYAAFLLRGHAHRRPADRDLARKMLREAIATMDERDHGWFQAHSNLAAISRVTGTGRKRMIFCGGC